jgi:lambda family phage portal protein
MGLSFKQRLGLIAYTIANEPSRTFEAFTYEPKKSTRSVSTRGYSAADSTARYGDFRTSRGSADYELRGGLAKVRAKSRWLYRNSSSMRRYINLIKTNVVGETGFIFQSRVRKLDGDLDEQLNKRVEKDFAEWSKTPTTCGKMTMADLQKQAIGVYGRDGEVIWEKVTNSRYKDRFAINPIEADFLDETLNTIFTMTGNEIRMGVEIREDGSPVAYHFLTRHPGDSSWYSQDFQRRYRRVEADRVIHFYERDRPGQTRGEPPTVTVINSIKMLDGYREAETVGRRLRSAVMGFFQKMKPTTRGIAELGDIDEDGNMIEANSDNSLDMSVTPGTLKELPEGIEFKQFDPGGSQTDYGQFEGQIKKDVSMGINLSVMSHGMETAGISYSAGRTVIGEDRDYYKTLQMWMVRSLMQETFRSWLSYRILSPDSNIPPTRFDAIVGAARFRPRGWDWVDPQKEVKANSEALRTKQTSLTRVLAARGIDLYDHLEEIAMEEKAAAKLGLTLEYNTSNAVNETKPNNNSDDEDD